MFANGVSPPPDSGTCVMYSADALVERARDQIRMPALAVGDLRLRGDMHVEYLRIALHSQMGFRRVGLQFAEQAPKVLVFVPGQVLVSENQHKVFAKRLPDFGGSPLREIGEINAADLGPQARGEWFDTDVRVVLVH